MRQTYGEAPVAIEAASTYFRKQMRTVERALETNPRYILGERFRAADILLSTCLTRAVHYGISVADPVVAYNARATAQPSYALAELTNGPL
jgi:glutathione S-transferase